MIEWVGNFFEWMELLAPAWAYAVLLLVAYGENVVPPIPGDLVVVFGGYLAGIGRLNLLVVIVLATAGGAAGFMTMYAIGRRFGAAALDPDRMRWLPSEGLERAQQWMDRYGFGVVLANRFLSGARSVISLTVGAAQMDATRTAIYCTISAAVWISIITYAGYAVGENWRIIGEYLRAYGRVVLVVLFLVGLAWLGQKYLRASDDTA
ncbi:DedA family protein [Salisaeta longa]|uniref:DedA family protein n=1 Tax=Salisaeta longa TaxID=503170 RepID=UPI0003B4B278|nr:DedA family protein [Salisaeta longa]